MRVLFTTTAGLGHIHPTVPLARAMAGRGHQVLWAAPPDGVEHIERAGLRAAAIGTPGLAVPSEAVRRYPELRALAQEDVPDVMFGKLFGAIVAPVLLADLVPLAEEWRPDLIVADAAELAGHIVGAELGVPHVTKGFGPILPASRMVKAAEEVAPLWRSRGLEPRPYAGVFDDLYLDIYPTGLPSPDASHVGRRQLLRPEIYDGPQQPAVPLPLPTEPAGAPLVYVTMGTVFNDPGLLERVVAAVAALDVRVLVTVGPRSDPAVLGAQPAHVRVERYVSQTAVLPQCDAVVSHGGSGTVVSALTHGLAQLCLPQGADQFLNAAAVAASGAGISLTPERAAPEAVRGAVERLLDQPSHVAAAGRVRESIAAMPSPDDVAVILEALP